MTLSQNIPMEKVTFNIPAELKEQITIVCKKWFVPNPRVGSRQKICENSDCKKEWHRRKSSEWNKKNSMALNR